MGKFIGKISIENSWDGTQDEWELQDDLTFMTKKKKFITALKGFFTDGASVPWYLRWAVSPLADPGVASSAVIHDALYRSEGFGVLTRKESDYIFMDALLTARENPIKVFAMISLLRLFGWTSFKMKDKTILNHIRITP